MGTVTVSFDENKVTEEEAEQVPKLSYLEIIAEFLPSMDDALNRYYEKNGISRADRLDFSGILDLEDED